MARFTIQLAALAAATPLFLSQPAAAADLPDRSALSYEENVIINTVCFSASRQGASAYERCVSAQLAALHAHPSPDRTTVSASFNRQIESQCSYLRHVGIAEYNDCIKKALATPAAATDTSENQIGPDIVKVFAAGPDRPKESATTAATPVSLPLPSSVLPTRPGHIDRDLLSPAAVFKKVERSVFVVYATASFADARAHDVMLGSAVAVADHFLLTNCHVVANRPVIRIVRGETSLVANLVASEPKADRCILKSEGEPLTPIAGVRSYQDIAVGERVFAIGTPMGLDLTLTQGVVSSLRNIGGRNLVQTDAPISPGNSGGGLFDESGNLIGITTLASRAGIQNLNFAVAASDFWEQR